MYEYVYICTYICINIKYIHAYLCVFVVYSCVV